MREQSSVVNRYLAERARWQRLKRRAQRKGSSSGEDGGWKLAAASSAVRALAWVLGRGEDVVPIPGTKRRAYLEENVAATEIELTDDDLARLDEAAPPGITAGDRYPDMSTVES